MLIDWKVFSLVFRYKINQITSHLFASKSINFRISIFKNSLKNYNFKPFPEMHEMYGICLLTRFLVPWGKKGSKSIMMRARIFDQFTRNWVRKKKFHTSPAYFNLQFISAWSCVMLRKQRKRCQKTPWKTASIFMRSLKWRKARIAVYFPACFPSFLWYSFFMSAHIWAWWQTL